MNQSLKKVKRFINWNTLILVFQILFSTIFAYLFKKILPMKYWLIVIALLLFLFLLSFMMLKRKKRKNSVIAFYRIISMLICVFLAFGSVIVHKGLNALDAISGGNIQTQVISIVVKNDSLYETLDDLSGKTIGYVSKLDEENTAKALEKIRDIEKVNVNTQEFDTLDEVQKSLFNEEIDALLFNEAYRGILQEFNDEFDFNTKTVYQYQIQQEIASNDTKVKVSIDSFNVFISGIDTYGPVSTVSRSDVNMIVTVNPTTKEILMTSIPRDFYVKLASFGAYDKLTHAGVYGVEESIATLENLFGIEIDYYARVNFTSLVTMVDALGGITVDNPQAFTGYHTHEYYPQGLIEMDGSKALEFARERYGLPGGDRDRVKNQQRVLAAMLNKMMSSTIIKNYSSVLNAVSGCFETSMSSSDIQSLIQMQLDDMSEWTIEQISVDGYGSSSTNCYSMPGWNLYVMEPDYSTVDIATEKIKSVENGTKNQSSMSIDDQIE